MADGVKESGRPARLMSLDALRGFDMLWIIGFSYVVLSFCAWLGAKDCWIAQQMTHVAWHGFHQRDTIFPLFIFLAGVSWPFSYAGQVAKGRTTAQILRKISFRVVALFALGLVTSSMFLWKTEDFRYDSVLAHIGVCWAGAAILYMFVRSWKARLAVVVALLVGHWALLFFLVAPDAAALLASTDPTVAEKVSAYAAYGTDGFSFTGNIAGWIDRTFMPGSLYEGVFDPDGLLSKVTGVALASLGVMAGELLRGKQSGNRKALTLAAAGVVAVALVFVFQPICPVNKKIWTSTFVFAAAGYSFLMLAIFYWIIDVRGFRAWSFFFRVIGMNSITIYIMMRFVDFRFTSKFFLGGIAGLGSEHWSWFVIWTGQIACEWVVLWFLYRKNTFLRV